MSCSMTQLELSSKSQKNPKSDSHIDSPLSILTLPKEFLFRIFSFLTASERARDSRTCKIFYAVTKPPAILQHDILSVVFNFLTLSEQGRMRRTCKACRSVVAESMKLDFRHEAIDAETIFKGYQRIGGKSISAQLSEDTTDQDLACLVGLPIHELDLSLCIHLTSSCLHHLVKLPLTTLNMPLKMKKLDRESLSCLVTLKPTLKNLDLKLYPGLETMSFSFLKGLDLERLTVNQFADCRYLERSNLFLRELMIKELVLNTNFMPTKAWSPPRAVSFDFLPTLKHLESLHLKGGKEVSLTLVAGLPLVRIKLEDCSLLADEDALKTLYRLQTFDLSQAICEITDSLILSLIDLPLETLALCDVLDSSGISDATVKHLLRLPLKELELSNFNRLTDESLRWISGIETLRSLRMRNCMGITDEGIEHLSHCNLEVLDISGNFVGAERGLKALRKLPHLTKLRMGPPDEGLFGFRRKSSPGLSWDRFDHVNDRLPLIAELPLVELDLPYKDVDDGGLRTLSHSPRLRSLSLPRSTSLSKVSFSGVSSLHLTHLEGLDRLREHISDEDRMSFDDVEQLDNPEVLKLLNLGCVKVICKGASEVSMRKNGEGVASWRMEYPLASNDGITWMRYVLITQSRIHFQIVCDGVMEKEPKHLLRPGMIVEITPILR